MIRNDTIDTLLAHRSVRGFTDDPLPAGAEEAVREAMRRGPTSSALQTYTVVFIDDPATKAGIRPHAGNQAFLEQCPLMIVACADLRRVENVTARRSYPYRAPDLRMLISAVEDLTIAVQNASITAQSMGLGTVMIGGVLNGMAEIHTLLGLPRRVAPVLGLCIGTPAVEHRDLAARPRLPTQVVFHKNRYTLQADEEAAALALHDQEVMDRGYYDGRRIPWDDIRTEDDPSADPVSEDAYGWTEHVARKQARTWWLRAGPKLIGDLASLGLRISDPTPERSHP